jgi:hypothetical protein
MSKVNYSFSLSWEINVQDRSIFCFENQHPIYEQFEKDIPLRYMTARFHKRFNLS